LVSALFQASDDWCYFALIIDRLLLRIYLIGFIVGTLGYYLCVALTEYPKMMLWINSLKVL